jgi:hypothetical protein
LQWVDLAPQSVFSGFGRAVCDCFRLEGQPNLQGLAIPLPFGTLYTTNITPDKRCND